MVGRNTVATNCEMAFRDEISAKLEIALKQLRYKDSAHRKQLSKTLFDFKVADLKSLC